MSNIAYSLHVLLSRGLFSLTTRRYVHHRMQGSAFEGPFLMASNHVSHFDPPLLAATLPFKIDYMADAPLFSGWAGNAYFRCLNAFPVDRRRKDTASVREAVARLRSGRNVGMFPEGGIRDGERSILGGGPIKPGTATIARMADVPILPVVVIGSDRLYNPRAWRRFRSVPVWVGTGNWVRLEQGANCGPARRFTEGELLREMLEVRDSLRMRFGIRDVDMPQPPRCRMGEP